MKILTGTIKHRYTVSRVIFSTSSMLIFSPYSWKGRQRCWTCRIGFLLVSSKFLHLIWIEKVHSEHQLIPELGIAFSNPWSLLLVYLSIQWFLLNRSCVTHQTISPEMGHLTNIGSDTAHHKTFFSHEEKQWASSVGILNHFVPGTLNSLCALEYERRVITIEERIRSV